jgi:hypothetical protein
MAIEYFPRTYPNAPARYLLMVYGQAGKVLFQSPYQSLDALLEALRAAGISLQKEEELVIRDRDVENHYVLVADKVHLNDSQISPLGLRPTNFATNLN